jgi:hypothetical protein
VLLSLTSVLFLLSSSLFLPVFRFPSFLWSSKQTNKQINKTKQLQITPTDYLLSGHRPRQSIAPLLPTLFSLTVFSFLFVSLLVLLPWIHFPFPHPAGLSKRTRFPLLPRFLSRIALSLFTSPFFFFFALFASHFLLFSFYCRLNSSSFFFVCSLFHSLEFFFFFLKEGPNHSIFQVSAQEALLSSKLFFLHFKKCSQTTTHLLRQLPPLLLLSSLSNSAFLLLQYENR